MKEFIAVFKRDVRLAAAQGGGLGLAIGFFLIVVSLFPFGIGPDLKLLARVAPGILWIALLLSVLLSLDRMFQADFEDGSLEQLVVSRAPLEAIIVAKVLAHWMTTGVPLILATPVLGLFLNLDEQAFGVLVLSMLIGTPALNFVGAAGAALTVGIRRGGLLLSLIVLPLYVPILVFGVSAIQSSLTGPSGGLQTMMILGALTLGSAALAPFAAAAALRVHLR
jgi:heme exporter protein B